MYLFTIFPYLYFLKTRLKGKIQKISWVFVYFIPNIFLYLYITDFDISFNNIFTMILSLILINYIYENGYIQNDIILTKRETNPTLRIYGEELDNIRKNIRKIFLIRFVITIFILILIFILVDDYKIFISILTMSVLLQSLYLIYNSVRSVLNLYLILPLSYIRFYGFIIPFVPYKHLVEFIILTIFIYPFSKFLEFTKQPRYGYEKISKLVGNVDLFRIKYYLIITIIYIIFYFLIEINYIYIFVALYYLAFRFSSYIAINRIDKIKQDISKNSKKEYRG